MPDDAVVRYEYAQLLRDLNVQDEAVKQARRRSGSTRRCRRRTAFSARSRSPRARRTLRDSTAASTSCKPGAASSRPEDLSTAAALARALLARGRAGRGGAASRRASRDADAAGAPADRRRGARQERARRATPRSSTGSFSRPIRRDREIAAALIDVYEEDDRYDEALKLLAELATKDPENPAVSERITLDLARAGRFDEAEKRARDLADQRPENRDIRRLLAQVLFEKGDVAGGEKILRDLLKTDPEDEGSRRALAGELLRERRFPEARALFEESLRRAGADPKAAEQTAWATRELAYASYLQKDYAAARKALEPHRERSAAGRRRARCVSCSRSPRDSEDFASGLAAARAAAAAEPANPEWEAAVAEFQYRTRRQGRRDRGVRQDGGVAGARARHGRRGRRGAREGLRDGRARSPARRREAIPGEHGGAVPARVEPREGGLARRGREDLPEAPRREAERRGDAELPRVHVGGPGRAPREGARRSSRRRSRGSRATARTATRSAGRTSASATSPRRRRTCTEAQRREPDDPTIEEHLGDLAERQGRVDEAVRHWERVADARSPTSPDKVREKLKRARAKIAGATR